MGISAELIKRVILEQREDEQLPSKHIHRLAEEEFPELKRIVKLLSLQV